MNFLSRLRVGSVLIYPSKDASAQGQRARAFIRYEVKQDQVITGGGVRRGAIEYVASLIAERLQGSGLEEVLGQGGCLVPVPRHGLQSAGALWPAFRICEELRRVGIGDDLQPCIERTTPVKQSSTSRPGERPGVREHYESTRVKPLLTVPRRIVLVDDVVTRGATLIACATRLHEQFPGVSVVAFSYARIDWDTRLTVMKEMFSSKVETIEYEASVDVLRRM